MLNFIQKLAAKPKDKTIRLTRGVFAFFLLLVIVLGWDVTAVNFGLPEYIKYLLFIFPFVGIIRSIFDPGVFRKKVWKWTIVGFGVSMVVLSLVFLEDRTLVVTSTTPTVSGEQDISSLIQNQSEEKTFTLSTDNWFGFSGFILLVIGFFLNGKNITTKNERYGEKITKIRV